MHNIVEFSSVVDRLRSNSGSALKSLQRNFEETALKAAGLDEDDEALYKLSKHTQTYLRAADALQQAANTLADDFIEAMEDLALRDVARKFRDANKSTSTLHLAALSKDLEKPVKDAVGTDDYATRQKLIGKAFAGLLDVNLGCFRAATNSLDEAYTAAQQLLKDKAKPKPTVGRQAPPAAPTAPAPASNITRRATAPAVSFAEPMDDLLDFGGAATVGLGGSATGSSSAKDSGAKRTSNLLDFEDFGSAPVNGTSSPPQRATAASSNFDILGGGTSPSPQASTSSIPLDFDFHSPAPAAPSQGYTAAGASPAGASCDLGSLGSLGTMSWTTKEEEDESSIKARVAFWQDGKNLRTMLCSLHEVAPSCSGWTPVKWDDLEEASDVKLVYRKAVLAVHPDKHNDKGGEKILGDLVFKALREQWSIFRSS